MKNAKVINIDSYQNQETSAPNAKTEKSTLTLRQIAEQASLILDNNYRKFQTTQVLKEWLNIYQFETKEGINIGLELETEKIIFFENEKISRFSNIEMIKSAMSSIAGISPDYNALKMQHLPMCSVIFDTKNPQISVFSGGQVKFTINTYKKNHLQIVVQKRQLRAKSRIALDIDYLLSKYTPSCKEIIFNLFQVKEERKYFYNWLSFIANSGEKTRNAIILRGVQGTGKNSLADYILTPFFGQRYCKTVSNDDIRSQFNGIFENLLFVFFNEVKPDFNAESTVYEKLKALITDNAILVNEKYIKVRQTNNIFNCMFFSNNPVPVVIEASDRRYSIFTSNVKLEDKFSKDEIKDIIDTLPSELINFWDIISNLDYDPGLAGKCYINEAKQIITETTQEWAYLVCDYLLKKDKKDFIKYIANDMAVSKIKIEMINKIVNEIEHEINNGYVSSDIIYKIYLLVNGVADEPSPADTEKLRLFTRKKLARKISGKLGNIKQIREKENIRYVWQI